jgi:uncharacterized delta-60 repeat protein
MKNLIITILTFCVYHSSFAQDGFLDSTFNSVGIATKLVGDFTTGDAVLIQPDGKILVGVSSIIAPNADISILRYNANGSLDLTFNNTGISTFNINTTGEYCTSIALQSDGKILACGYSSDALYNSSSIVMRFNANGTIDNSFGIGGLVTTKFHPKTNFAQDILVQKDGRIVVAGNTKDTSLHNVMLVNRYLSNGTLDNSFDNDGTLIIDFGGFGSSSSSVTQQTDEKIVIAGTCNVAAGNTKMTLTRLNENGSFDVNFNLNGTLISSLNGSASTCLEMQSDGKIVMGGFRDSTTLAREFAVLRYRNNGIIDSSFDDDGIVTTKVGNYQNTGFALAIQSSGKIIIGGFSKIAQQAEENFTLVRYKSNGVLDSTFHNDGIVITSQTNAGCFLKGLAIQSDSKIVAVGGVSENNLGKIMITRYNNPTIPAIPNFLEPQIENINYTIFPNPIGATAIISLDIYLKDAQLSLYDLTGKLVWNKKNISGQIVRLENLNLINGSYLLKIMDTSRVIMSEQIVIHN